MILRSVLLAAVAGVAGVAWLGTTPASAQPPNVVTVSVGASDPAVSSDGSRLAVSILGKIWLMPVSGGDATQLTFGPGWDRHPAWSPDGSSLAYSHATPSGSDVIVRNFASGSDAFIYHSESNVGQMLYHPTGGSIFFVLERGQYDAHLWRMSATGEDAKQLTFTENWHEWSFAPSSDGTKVLLESGRYGGADLYLASTDSGSEVTRLTRTPANEFGVAWSRDGTTRGWIVGDNGVDSVMVQPTDGRTPPRRVFTSAYDQKQLTLAPNGGFAVLCAGRRLYRIDVAGGRSEPIQFSARFTLPPKQPADLVITHARVWTGVSAEAMNDASVVVRDGRITAVQLAGAPIPVGIPTIDARGKTLLPGLMDNHWHYWNALGGNSLLVRGVTSIRDPGVAISASLDFRDAIRLGMVAGPDIYTAGPLIDGVGGYHPMVDVELSRADAAAPLVRALKAQGADLLKVYFLLDPPVLRAVVAEAKRQGLPVTGHIGVRTSLGEALDAGIDGFSHVRAWKDFLPREEQPQGENETLDGSRAPVARMQADWRKIDPDGPEALALIRRMTVGGFGFDPTLTIQAIPPTRRTGFSLEEYSVAQDAYKRMGRFVARAQKEGVMLLAGTDDGDLFAEVEAYVDAGVPVIEALKAATVNGARWLGREKEFGTIEVGKRADLVLVDGDPLKTIKDLRKTQLVVKGGRVVFRK